MTGRPPKFKREPAKQRKDALILATLSLIGEHGVRGATVRAIAERAAVSQGLIRHYFSTKDELITATYEYHMNYLTDLTSSQYAPSDAPAKTRLEAFIQASLVSPVVDSHAVSLWASFLNKVSKDAGMQAIHKNTYRKFRDRLEHLIALTLRDANMPVTAQETRQFAIAGNAIIDGLWMEGGALPDEFDPGELPKIGLNAIGAIIGLPLEYRQNQT